MMGARISLIVLGASAGGVSALQRLLSELPKEFPVPMVVVQHLPARSAFDFGMVFGRYFHGPVEETIDKMPIRAGHVYFAPPSYHVLIEGDGTLALSQDDLVNFSRPSIDVLFESAAAALGSRLCGVLLTGANEDGARGLRAIRERGGKTVVQDPKEAEVATMPDSALALIRPDCVSGIAGIAAYLTDLSRVTL